MERDETLNDEAGEQQQAQAPPPIPSWKTLRELPLSTKEFEAGGNIYRVYNSVSFDRWEAYELLQIEVGMARSFEQHMNGLREAYDLCQRLHKENVYGDLAVLLRDLIIGGTLVGERQTHPVLRMCALFINREGEDVRLIDEATIESKVNDWRTAGIDMKYFFQFALHSIPGFFAAYKAISRDILKKPEEESRADQGSTLRPEHRS